MKKLLNSAACLLLIVSFFGTEALTQGRIPMLGEQAPSFNAETTMGKIAFPDDYGKYWKILLSHPKDFTPVCTSEIMELAKMQQDFDRMGVKLAVISTDDLASHVAWKGLMEDLLVEYAHSEKISFPLIDDASARVSNKYGMLHAWEDQTRDVRGVFIIDPENYIRSINFYPMNVGRNMVEIKRVVTALQLSDSEQVLTPANWNNGDDVLMKYVPYSEEDLLSNPALKDQYYKVGINMWYKKALASE